MARSATTDRYQEIVEAARKRWKSRRRVISTARKNADQQAWTKLDTPERLIQRAERLGNWLAAAQKLEKQSPEDALALALVAEDQGKLDALKHDSAARESAREEARKLRDKPDQIDDRTFERILGGSRDLLSVEFFEQGLLAARSVGMVSTDQQENGTGFLVGPGMMLTNWHVLEDAAMAERSDMMLDFETNRVGPHKDSQIFPFDPETFFLANKKLDYALVAVQPTSLQGGQLESFGFLPLIGTTGKAVAGECVNVVQHPRGKAKQICIRNNRILDLPGSAPKPDEELDPYLLYEADTERGSSGSPVCNDQWEVVALHHAALPENGQSGRGETERSTSDAVWIANEGIRTSRIVRDMRERCEGLDPEQRSRLMALLDLWGNETRPLVPESLAPRPGMVLPPREPPVHDQSASTVQSISGDVEVEIPLRLTIRLGPPRTSTR